MLVGGSDEIDTLLQSTPEEPPTLEKALADLPRMLSPRRTAAAMNIAGDGEKK
jgi:hypothetical protein